MSTVFKIKISLLLGIFFIAPAYSFAAIISFDPAQKEVHYGDTFVLDLRLDNEGECVNAMNITIRYDNKIVDAVDFGRGESLLTLWVDTPKIDHTQGTVTFSGGIPGGYCGRVVGDPGLSNLLGKVVFSTTGNQIVPQTGAIAVISIAENSEVLLNDGLGTKAVLTTSPTQVTVQQQQSLANNEWTDQIEKDSIPPEAFLVHVHQDQNVAGGKYFITFTTVDKQSGIDHFEVHESNLDNPGYEVDGKLAQWRVIENNEQYYVLRDQTLKSKVLVKAFDKAGNFYLAELGDEGEIVVVDTDRSSLMKKIFIGIAGIGAVGVVIGLIMLLVRRKREQTEEVL